MAMTVITQKMREQAEDVVWALIGTQDLGFEEADALGMELFELEFIASDMGVERCPQCDTWVESYDIILTEKGYRRACMSCDILRPGDLLYYEDDGEDDGGNGAHEVDWLIEGLDDELTEEELIMSRKRRGKKIRSRIRAKKIKKQKKQSYPAYPAYTYPRYDYGLSLDKNTMTDISDDTVMTMAEYSCAMKSRNIYNSLDAFSSASLKGSLANMKNATKKFWDNMCAAVSLGYKSRIYGGWSGYGGGYGGGYSDSTYSATYGDEKTHIYKFDPETGGYVSESDKNPTLFDGNYFYD